MISSFRNMIRRLRSGEPADLIRVDRRLRELPVIGPVWEKFQRVRAQLTQRNADDYLAMQRRTFELFASADEVRPGEIVGDYVAGSWRQHDEWEDYETYLMKYVPRDASWLAIEYGCGPGRNLRRWSDWFQRIDGVDISAQNLENARLFLSGVIPAAKMPRLFLTAGRDCGDAPQDAYDFAFSTICLQHICVWEVRYAILGALFHCLKPGGRLSVQMGYGNPSPATVPYHANYYAAHSTNRESDTEIASAEQVREDLARIGFEQFEHWIRPTGPGDIHPNWIFFTAVKPATKAS